MDEKNLDAQQIADEELAGAAGGARANARLDARTRETAAVVAGEEEEVDASSPCSPWVVICPNCGRTLRNCTCARN